MKSTLLNRPSTLHHRWSESDDRRQVELVLYVDGWEVDTGYALEWLDGAPLAEAIAHGQPVEAHGWYIIDAAGDVFTTPLEPLNGGPLDRFICQALSAELEARCAAGAPPDLAPASALKTFFLSGKHFLAEGCRDGVLINPVLPPGFEDTPLNERPPLELQRWEGRPFVVTRALEDQLQSFEHYAACCRHAGLAPRCSPAEWDAEQAERRRRWLERFPSGIAYSTRCLDGWAWDRDSWWGDAATLDEALAIARTGPAKGYQGGPL